MADAPLAPNLPTGLADVPRQMLAFGGAGIAAAIAHYGTLIALVEGGALAPVPAALCGYVAGGVVSYGLNRRHTYRSDRRHREAMWRFAVVAGIGFLLTFAAMRLLVDRLAVAYLPAQLLTTGLVMIWSFAAHKGWTFRDRAALPDAADRKDRRSR